MTDYTQLIESMRSFEEDRKPDGWLAIKMHFISEMCDAIEDLQARVTELEDAAFVSRGMLRLAHGERDAALAKPKELEAQEPRTYMDGYSDGKKWAMEQVQPEPVSQARAEAWKYDNEAGVSFLTFNDPKSWHDHEKHGFKNFKPLFLEQPEPVSQPVEEHGLSLSFQIRRAIKAEDALTTAKNLIKALLNYATCENDSGFRPHFDRIVKEARATLTTAALAQPEPINAQLLDAALELRHALSNVLQQAPKEIWPKWLEVRDRADAVMRVARDGASNMCENCAMDLATCDCVESKPVAVKREPAQPEPTDTDILNFLDVKGVDWDGLSGYFHSAGSHSGDSLRESALKAMAAAKGGAL